MKKLFTLVGCALIVLTLWLAVFANKAVLDPNKVLNPIERMAIGLAVSVSPIRTKVILYKDLTPESVGKELAEKVPSRAPLDPKYYPAGDIAEVLAGRDQIGEKDLQGQSMLLVVTALRGDPKIRWALSVSEHPQDKLTPNINGAAYRTFAEAIAKQHNNRKAGPYRITLGLWQALPVLYKAIRN